MKMDAYLSPSRHGIFYFRWPLPPAPDRCGRATVRLSLRTRCPKRASQLARHLSSFGCDLKLNNRLPAMRHDEMRAKVRGYFQAALERQLERLNEEGLPERKRMPMENGVACHAEGVDGDTELSDAMLDFDPIRTGAGFPEASWEAHGAFLKREIRKAARDR